MNTCNDIMWLLYSIWVPSRTVEVVCDVIGPKFTISNNISFAYDLKSYNEFKNCDCIRRILIEYMSN